MLFLLKKWIKVFLTKNTNNHGTDVPNPFLKEGDYVYLHNMRGRHKVVSVREDGFYALSGSLHRNRPTIFCSWKDFRRWSGKRSNSANAKIGYSNNIPNPFLKEGDYVYLYNIRGRHKVMSVRENGFYTLPDFTRGNMRPIFCSWNDFKRWSGKNNGKTGAENTFQDLVFIKIPNPNVEPVADKVGVPPANELIMRNARVSFP